MSWAGSSSLPEYIGVEGSGSWIVLCCAGCLCRVDWREVEAVQGEAG